ncbi:MULTISPECIES: carbohydrate ABC transporter permease [unclassified Curtobacterium]|uniref:carbohydrate ABC transporter permease n=1 Tax=Bacteria TaxID=2 RepID=UPI00104CAA0D|nr:MULTISPECIES: carbohydrate ABC transporter permease [unclassified Curtobacterium]TCL80716.1 carbohydrate ABC transporter membrane protein 2 (CUT1 family) [Curtobacterium sp. PhB128]TCL98840.1 carbohydrate ABC transporter membrane protein 2 (CUT1 family) [Curtobacterium sp. PhB138]
MSTIARPVWAGKPTPVVLALKAVAIVLILAVVLFPFLIVFSTSVSSQADVTAAGGYVVWPRSFDLSAYVQILSGGVVTRAVVTTLLVTVVGTVISLASTVLAAWALSRQGSLFQRPLLTFVLITFLFAPGMIPLYLMVKQLGLLDNYWALILPSAFSVFNMVVVRGFMMSIPQELIDSAKIDGAGEFRILWQLVLPLSRAVIAVVGLFYAVGYWNAFFNALLYLSDSTKWTLQLVLRTYVLQGSSLVSGAGSDASMQPPAESIQMAVVMIAIIPILAAYPLVQRHLTKGVLTGAVKG